MPFSPVVCWYLYFVRVLYTTHDFVPMGAIWTPSTTEPRQVSLCSNDRMKFFFRDPPRDVCASPLWKSLPRTTSPKTKGGGSKHNKTTKQQQNNNQTNFNFNFQNNVRRRRQKAEYFHLKMFFTPSNQNILTTPTWPVWNKPKETAQLSGKDNPVQRHRP